MYLSLTHPPHRLTRPRLIASAAAATGPASATAVRPGPVRAAPLRWWREVILVGVLYTAYELSRSAVSGSMARSINRGRSILDWERSWHLAPEHAVNTVFSHSTALAVAASYLYSTLHYLITPIVLVWMFRRHPAHYRFARTWLAFGTVLGLVMFTLLPTAPPRLIPGSGIRDTLASVSRYGWWGGDGSVPRGLGSATNQVAAMPSLHIGWAAWCGVLIAAYAARRWVRALGVLYPVVMVFVVIGTGNHYLLDAAAGVAVMAVAAALALLARQVVRHRRS